MFKEEGKIG